MTKCLAILLGIIGLLAASCAPHVDHGVKISQSRDGFLLSLHTPEIAEKCYAPDGIRFNPMLDLSNFVDVNRWTIVPDEHVSSPDLNAMLSARRKKVGGTVELLISRDSVATRPSYLSFVAFPCDAPAEAKGWKGDILMVVASADVPTFYPPGHGEPRAGDPARLKNLVSSNPSGNVQNR